MVLLCLEIKFLVSVLRFPLIMLKSKFTLLSAFVYSVVVPEGLNPRRRVQYFLFYRSG